MSVDSGSIRPPEEFLAWLAERRVAIDERLAAHLSALKSSFVPHSRLLDAVAYSLQEGGKRLRPMLVEESCRVGGGSEEQAWPAAVAIECIHTFSLIHDDLPAMDDDDLRRGRPTSHKTFGEAQAILAGDWLVAHAFEVLASAVLPREAVGMLVAELASATQGMVAGQAADIDGASRPTDGELVRFIHLHKTARMFEAACRMGAIAAGAASDRVDALGSYGRSLGLAFQVADDVLDCTATTGALGKRAGKDAGESKQTYPAAFGIAQSRERAQQEIDSAIAVLAPFGSRADRLRDVAVFVLRRDH